jgi:hypothetical protein
LSFPIFHPYFLGFSPCSFFLLSLPGPLFSSNDKLTHPIVVYLINHKVEPAIILYIYIYIYLFIYLLRYTILPGVKVHSNLVLRTLELSPLTPS